MIDARFQMEFVGFVVMRIHHCRLLLVASCGSGLPHPRRPPPRSEPNRPIEGGSSSADNG
jgi:hypothetical protein